MNYDVNEWEIRDIKWSAGGVTINVKRLSKFGYRVEKLSCSKLRSFVYTRPFFVMCYRLFLLSCFQPVICCQPFVKIDGMTWLHRDTTFLMISSNKIHNSHFWFKAQHFFSGLPSNRGTKSVARMVWALQRYRRTKRYFTKWVLRQMLYFLKWTLSSKKRQVYLHFIQAPSVGEGGGGGPYLSSVGLYHSAGYVTWYNY